MILPPLAPVTSSHASLVTGANLRIDGGSVATV